MLIQSVYQLNEKIIYKRSLGGNFVFKLKVGFDIKENNLDQ